MQTNITIKQNGAETDVCFSYSLFYFILQMRYWHDHRGKPHDTRAWQARRAHP